MAIGAFERRGKTPAGDFSYRYGLGLPREQRRMRAHRLSLLTNQPNADTVCAVLELPGNNIVSRIAPRSAPPGRLLFCIAH